MILYAKTDTVPRNMGWVDHPTLSFWRSPERLHGSQLRIISMKGKEVEYLSHQPSMAEYHQKTLTFSYPHLTCAEAKKRGGRFLYWGKVSLNTMPWFLDFHFATDFFFFSWIGLSQGWPTCKRVYGAPWWLIRLRTQGGHYCGTGSTPGLGSSACCGCGQQNK